MSGEGQPDYASDCSHGCLADGSYAIHAAPIGRDDVDQLGAAGSDHMYSVQILLSRQDVSEWPQWASYPTQAIRSGRGQATHIITHSRRRMDRIRAICEASVRTIGRVVRLALTGHRPSSCVMQRGDLMCRQSSGVQ
jgi:hypothetical protein